MQLVALFVYSILYTKEKVVKLLYFALNCNSPTFYLYVKINAMDKAAFARPQERILNAFEGKKPAKLK